jgi:hypothetical protein
MDSRKSSVKHHFVFRLDGSKENDEFFGKRCCLGDVVAYSGTAMLVGPGWIPDIVEVESLDDASIFTITLVELEAQDITARASCRKYLPESSDAILNRFLEYLEGMVKQCQATTDPRLNEFMALQTALSRATRVEVRTAGALRSAADYLELHALLDQPNRLNITNGPPAANTESFDFKGNILFSREAKDGLRRTVRVLHAVIAGQDHSDGTLHSWHNVRRKPLDSAVAKSAPNYPLLNLLLQNKSPSGMRLDCDLLASELAALWSITGAHQWTATAIGETIRRFAPICIAFSGNDSMRDVFEKARSALQENAV